MTDHLKNPYEDDPTVRTSVRTEHTVHSLRPSIEDYNYIKTMHSRGNTLQLTFYHLLTKFVNELRKQHGPVAKYDPDIYEQAIRDFGANHRGTGSADTGPHQSLPRGDVGRGDRSLALSSPGHQQQPSNVPSDGTEKGAKKRNAKKSS